MAPQLSHSSNQVTGDKGSTLKVYQVWKGSNKFCFGGRFIFGPDARSLFYSVFLIVVPVTLFCTFVSENLINEFQPHAGYLIIVFCVVLTIYDIVLLLLTSGTDPGIIPRNLHPPEPEDGSNLSTDWLGNDSQRLPSTKDVMVNGNIVRVKYCQTCMLYRPPRCSHCSICNNCVERFDHHCPWVGQCIGKRNYRFYFMFVSSTTMLCLYVFAFCLVNFRKLMHKYHCNVWRAFLKSPVSGILIMYTCLTAWFVGGLTAFHLYLISTNQTTYENSKYGYDRKMNPYNLGCLHNFLDIFFSKRPVSKNNFRAKIEENSSMTDTKPMSMSHPMSSELPKQSIDVEMGRRQAVAAEDFEDLQTHIESVGGLERCGTHTRPIDRDKNMNWEINPDLHMYAAKFEVERSLTDRQKIHISQ